MNHLEHRAVPDLGWVQSTLPFCRTQVSDLKGRAGAARRCRAKGKKDAQHV